MPDKFDDPFPPESLKDRGQLSQAEYEAWMHHLYIKGEDDTAQSYPMSNWDSGRIENYKRRKSEYEDSGFNFEEHKPLGFGSKTHWFAIKSSDVVGLVNALSAGFQYKMVEIGCATFNPNQGYSYPGFHRRDSNGFLTVLQPAGGMIFAQRHSAGKILGGSYKKCIETILCPWTSVSEQFGDVTLFWGSGSGGNGALAWRQGKLKRGFSSGQDYKITGFGIPEDFEVSTSESSSGNFYLSYDDIQKMSAHEKANSSYIRPLRPGEKAYYWLVDI